MAISFTTQARSDRATALNTTLGTSAQVRIYSGTAPADANTALSGNTLLATCTCNATAFGSVASGVLTAGAISNGTAAATGTASFARLLKSDGTTVVLQCTAGTTGTDVILNTTSLVSGGPVAISSCVITEG